MEFWIVILVLAVGYLGIEHYKGCQRQRHLETQLKNLAYQFTTVKPSGTESSFASEATPPPNADSIEGSAKDEEPSTEETLSEPSHTSTPPASAPTPQPAYVVASSYKPTATATSEAAPTPSDATATFSTWLLRTGVALVTLGMAWGVHYACVHQLIHPWLQCSLGLLLGGGFIAGGFKALEHTAWQAYRAFAHTAVWLGLALIYLIVYALCHGYELLPVTWAPWFVLAVVALASHCSLRLQSPWLAGAGAVGMFLTPLVFPDSLMPSVLSLNLLFWLGCQATLIYTILQQPRWRFLVWIGLLGFLLSFINTLHDAFLHYKFNLLEYTLMLASVYAVWWGYRMVFARIEASPTKVSLWWEEAILASIFSLCAYGILKEAHQSTARSFTFASCSVAYATWALRGWLTTPKQQALSAFSKRSTGLAILFMIQLLNALCASKLHYGGVFANIALSGLLLFWATLAKQRFLTGWAMASALISGVQLCSHPLTFSHLNPHLSANLFIQRLGAFATLGLWLWVALRHSLPMFATSFNLLVRTQHRMSQSLLWSLLLLGWLGMQTSLWDALTPFFSTETHVQGIVFYTCMAVYTFIVSNLCLTPAMQPIAWVGIILNLSLCLCVVVAFTDAMPLTNAWPWFNPPSTALLVLIGLQHAYTLRLAPLVSCEPLRLLAVSGRGISSWLMGYLLMGWIVSQQRMAGMDSWLAWLTTWIVLAVVLGVLGVFGNNRQYRWQATLAFSLLGIQLLCEALGGHLQHQSLLRMLIFVAYGGLLIVAAWAMKRFKTVLQRWFGRTED